MRKEDIDRVLLAIANSDEFDTINNDEDFDIMQEVEDILMDHCEDA